MNLKSKNKNTLFFILILGFFAAIVFCSESAEGMKRLGGLSNIAQNSGEVERIAQFAVQQHNKKQNTVLKLKSVVKAKEQVVEGKMYYLTLEVDGGINKIYEAKVWVKPWMNFTQLEEFKPDQDNNPSFASSHLGVGHGR